MSTVPGLEAHARPVVTAVVVAHDGAPWLGELISGLTAQRRAPDRVIVVDTGSRDGSREQLAQAFGGAVLDAPRTTGFGAAVAHAVKALPPRQPGEWLWLLHDDCAPAPEALEALVRMVETVPSAAVIGPKLRDWPQGRRLLELGVTIAGSGNRETGLEFGEYDQGQHDSVRDVLAVSTAGMLVRRDVFEHLGGFDPQLPLFRDDVDFGWRVAHAGHRVITCPDALVHHAEAGHRGYRRLDAVKGRSRRVDRRNAMYTLLVNSAAWMMPLLAVRLALGSVLRALGLLIVKWPDAAWDEFRALGVLVRPERILLARRWRAGHRRVSRRAIRHLLPPPWIGLQHTLDALAAMLSARSGAHAGSARRSRRPVETGPVSEESEELTTEGLGIWRWLAARPWAIVTLALLVLALTASRDLLGGGALGGGALLPAPDSVVDLWQRYVESWHPVELGSPRAAPPYITVVAALGTLLGGKVWLAVDVLLIGSVPLAGLTCYVLVRRVARARIVQVWATITYALLPAVTGAIAAGRLGTSVAIIVLPLLGLAVLRMMGAGAARAGSWSAAWTAGLILAVLTAFVPAGYLAALVAGAIACAVPLLRKPGTRSRIAVALAVPPLALLPWLPVLAFNPGALLGEAGLAVPGLADSRLAPLSLLLANPGGPGAAPAWIFGLLLVVALAALIRQDHSRGVLAAWLVSLVGLALGLVQSRLSVQADWIPEAVPAWPGFAAALVAVGWIMAGTYAAHGARHLFGERSFSWQQPVAGLMALVAVGIPVAAAGWWLIRGTDGPLARSGGAAVPPYIRNAQESPDRPRALVVEAEGGSVRYALLRGSAARLGDAETGASRAALAGLDATVGDLLSDTRGDVTAARLAEYAIGFVYLPAPADPRSVERLDTTPGLSRASAPDGAAAWKVDLPVGELRVVPPGTDGAPGGARVADAEVLGIDGNGAALTVPEGVPDRRLVLAETYNSGWSATIDGQTLTPRKYAGWAQSFELPPDGGRVVLTHTTGIKGELLALQAIFVVLLIVFAIPSRPRREPSAPDYQPARHGTGGSRSDARPGRRAAGVGQPAGVGGSQTPAAGVAGGARSHEEAQR
ncbi:glycosyltransferase family 2 protein [Actinopolymorpha alba]|uniref:glycosyltransferase family 2 protein n=1 Tax=Actinopolymorpha alba TaxID=533267 RepID=UPI000377A5FB|nr:glycosyltransferase family 2 protein [Actinopolymorpha alba]